MSELQSLEDSIFRCNKCLELRNSRLYPMPGFFGSNIKLMVIGINPGPPQSGEADLLKNLKNDYREHYKIGIKKCLIGKFLDKAFKVMNINWDNLYFTNIIKCATPNVRLPNESEVKACKPYLRKQIKLVRPKNVLLLGKFPIQSLGLDMNLMECKKVNTAQIITIFHPTFIRRKGLEEFVLTFLSNIKLEKEDGIDC